VKRRVMFLGYYMFLLSQTIKEENLPTPIIPTEKYRYRLYLIPGKYGYQKNDWNQHGIQLYKTCPQTT